MEGATPGVAELRLAAADPQRWSEAGFEVHDGATRVGSTVIRFAGPEGGRGLVGWTLSGVDAADWDGLPTELELSARPTEASAPFEHPIGARLIDHVVVFTPELDRTIAAFEGNGVRCRRVRESDHGEQPIRQAFFRFGEVICEAVEVPLAHAGPDGTARLWGLTVTVDDLDGAVAELGPERCGRIRDAVQPGRRIATARRAAGLAAPVALITPEPAR